MSVAKKEKQQAPKWTTYFFKAKKKIKVIYQILFYANNKTRTCYATLERVAKDCQVSINTVYDAVKIALAIGILAKEEKATIYRIHPITKKPLFNKNIKLTYLGDTLTTAGIECFGERLSFFNLENGGKTSGENGGYIERKELSKERGKKSSFFSLENRIEEELKGYSKSLRESFKSQFESKYENKRRFIPIDFKEQIERFKRHNPLKSCYKCKDVHFESSSLCLKCTLEAQEKSLQGVYRDLGVKEHILDVTEMVEEPTSPKLKELLKKMDEMRRSKS